MCIVKLLFFYKIFLEYVLARASLYVALFYKIFYFNLILY